MKGKMKQSVKAAWCISTLKDLIGDEGMEEIIIKVDGEEFEIFAELIKMVNKLSEYEEKSADDCPL